MSVSHCHDEGDCRMVRVMIAALGNLVNNNRTLVILLAPYDLATHSDGASSELLYPILIPPQVSPYYFTEFAEAQRSQQQEFPHILCQLSGAKLKELHIFGDDQFIRAHIHFEDREGVAGVLVATPPDMLLFALQTGTPIFIEEKLLLDSVGKMKFNFVGDLSKQERGVTLPEEIRKSLGQFIAQRRASEHRRSQLLQSERETDGAGRHLVQESWHPLYQQCLAAMERDEQPEHLGLPPLLLSDRLYRELIEIALKLERYEWAEWLTSLDEEEGGWSYRPSSETSEAEGPLSTSQGGITFFPKSQVKRFNLVQVIYNRFRVYGGAGVPKGVDFCFRVAPRSGDPLSVLMQEQWRDADFTLNISGVGVRHLIQRFIESRKKSSLTGLPPDAIRAFQNGVGLFLRRLLLLKGREGAGSTLWLLELMSELGETYYVEIQKRGEALIYSFLYGLPIYATEEVLWEDELRQIPFREYQIDKQHGLEDIGLSRTERIIRSVRGEIPYEELRQLYPDQFLAEILLQSDPNRLKAEAVEREQYEWAQWIEEVQSEQAIWQQRKEK